MICQMHEWKMQNKKHKNKWVKMHRQKTDYGSDKNAVEFKS